MSDVTGVRVPMPAAEKADRIEELPEHLRPMFKDMAKDLSDEQISEVVQCMTTKTYLAKVLKIWVPPTWSSIKSIRVSIVQFVNLHDICR